MMQISMVASFMFSFEFSDQAKEDAWNPDYGGAAISDKVTQSLKQASTIIETCHQNSLFYHRNLY